MSDAFAESPPRRRPKGRRADTVQRLTDAAKQMLRELNYHELTLQAVAERAGVTRATAYTYFASKDHLIAETYWRQLAAATSPEYSSADPAERVLETLRHLASIIPEESGLANAMTATLTNTGPDVEAIRVRLFRTMRRLLAESLGESADDSTIRGIELLYIGAMVTATAGSVTYVQAADELEVAVRRLLASPAPPTRSV